MLSYNQSHMLTDLFFRSRFSNGPIFIKIRYTYSIIKEELAKSMPITNLFFPFPTVEFLLKIDIQILMFHPLNLTVASLANLLRPLNPQLRRPLNILPSTSSFPFLLPSIVLISGLAETIRFSILNL